MTDLSLAQARAILDAALDHGRKVGMKPLAIAVMDGRGALRALVSEDGASLKRADVAIGKAYGAVALGVGSRAIGKMAADRPHFVAAVSHVVGGSLVPVAGGVLIRNAAGQLIGAVGVSGDTSENDEAAAMAGIAAVGLSADPGA